MDVDQSLITEADNFISKLDDCRIDSRILFKDRLVTLSENTGKEVGELTISIDSSTYSGKECYLVQANSNGIVDTIPVGTNITAYVTPKLESLEHTQHEYVNIPGNPLTKRSVLSQTDDGYQLVLTTTEGGTETVTTEEFTKDEMARFISEGANLVLQRLSIILGVHSRMSFNVFSTDNALANVSYSPIESHSVLLQNVTLETIGIERCVDNKDENPTTWKIYFLSDGHMYTRAQVGSPVYMKIKDIPENFMKDEDADWMILRCLSHFLDRKEELKEDHVNYMKRHPELKAILGDFLQFLLMRKPSDVIEFAADFFSSYSATAEMKPSFAHSNFVNQSAIRSE
ncbi:ciliogenesis-associated TTC17-interacting protein-like [Bolinopsis microptera]|uniref:ciliogenesis-associated TTC17-interacting protein-like n=1 Tax=Bolinopsis microptera TaxID=2820187 RepID=UPI00307AE0BB